MRMSLLTLIDCGAATAPLERERAALAPRSISGNSAALASRRSASNSSILATAAATSRLSDSAVATSSSSVRSLYSVHQSARTAGVVAALAWAAGASA